MEESGNFSWTDILFASWKGPTNIDGQNRLTKLDKQHFAIYASISEQNTGQLGMPSFLKQTKYYSCIYFSRQVKLTKQGSALVLASNSEHFKVAK
jgi:hypothetical protein